MTDLVEGLSRLPVRVIALAFSSAVTTGILIVALRSNRRRLWFDLLVSWYLVTGMVIPWLGLSRIAENSAITDSPLTQIGLLNLAYMVIVCLWPLIWAINANSSGNDPAIVATMRQAHIIAACSGLIVPVGVSAVLRRRDRQSINRAPQP